MTDLHSDTDEPINHPLTGRRVTITLARAGDPTGGWDINFEAADGPRLQHDKTITGTLLTLTAGGECSVRQDNGTVMYGWPALNIREDPA